ncbi:hypothetical protein O3M35_010588 [Rhynocoris fuscipes]|uniref:Dual specificity protein phosphatase 23 n=1 Tax=Rhynocoris fuscipes TaxID=488301 RepID=A0AAW1D295_9HEMI
MDEDQNILAPWNFKWIIKKELAIMGYPKSEANVKYIVKEGITHLVSLSPEKQPSFEYFPNHIRWTPIDVLEFEPPSLEQIKSFIHVCKTALHNGEAVGVHCRLGRGRSGVMAACFLVHFYDQRPEYAVTNVRCRQPGAIETFSQERAVYKYYDYINTETETEDEMIKRMKSAWRRKPLVTIW